SLALHFLPVSRSGSPPEGTEGLPLTLALHKGEAARIHGGQPFNPQLLLLSTCILDDIVLYLCESGCPPFAAMQRLEECHRTCLILSKMITPLTFEKMSPQYTARTVTDRSSVSVRILRRIQR
ncbi:hypothetical protein KUCAC02_004606, partial [Chaenocephalus aceratus]